MLGALIGVNTVIHNAIILLLTGTVFVIICEMFRGRISLNLVLLLLLVNLVREFRLELIYTHIPYCKYQVKRHSCPWFLAGFSAPLVHIN